MALHSGRGNYEKREIEESLTTIFYILNILFLFPSKDIFPLELWLRTSYSCETTIFICVRSLTWNEPFLFLQFGSSSSCFYNYSLLTTFIGYITSFRISLALWTSPLQRPLIYNLNKSSTDFLFTLKRGSSLLLDNTFCPPFIFGKQEAVCPRI